jgi:hypothetical protein
MEKKSRQDHLKLVRPVTTHTQPPGNLKPPGKNLWSTVMAEYQIGDSGSLTLLGEACRALDRAEEWAAIIAKDGPTIYTKNGVRDHPLLKHELMARSFLTRTLIRIGIVDIPARPIGRPPQGGLGVTSTADDLLEEEE